MGSRPIRVSANGSVDSRHYGATVQGGVISTGKWTISSKPRASRLGISQSAMPEVHVLRPTCMRAQQSPDSLAQHPYLRGAWCWRPKFRPGGPSVSSLVLIVMPAEQSRLLVKLKRHLETRSEDC